MTNEQESGPATNGTASTHSHSYNDYRRAAHRRRRDASLRLEPLQCSRCRAWFHDPLLHNCTRPRLPVNDCPQHGIVLGGCPFTHDCGCEDPMRKGHRNDTCTQLGELPPPRVGPGSRRR